MFIAYSLYTGFASRREASLGLEEYFLAGRELKGWQAGLSMAATQFAADTPLLVTGLIATAGIFSLWQIWIYALAFLMMGFLLAPQWRRARVLTDAEFTELRYGGRAAATLRLVKAFYFGTIFNCVVLAWVLFAAAKISEPFLLWDLWLPEYILSPVIQLVQWVGVPLTNLPIDDPAVWAKTASNLISILAIVTVTTMYSTTGGLRSVVMTDIGQFGLMMFGTLLFAVTVVTKAGGLSAIHQQVMSTNHGSILPNEILAFTPSRAKDATFSILALYALQWIIQLNADGTGYLAQRAMACATDRDSKIAGVVFTIAQVLLRSLLWIPLGLGLLVLFPIDGSLSPALQTAAAESHYVRGIAELLPVGLKGLMITAMLAALASTLDTHLNWGASYWANDIYKRFYCEGLRGRKAKPRTLVVVARLANILILVIALAVMTRLSSIREAWQMSLLLGAGMGPVLILRWIWWRMNAWSEISVMLALMVFAPVLLLTVEEPALRLLMIAALSLVVAITVTFLKGPEDKKVLRAFYDRVKPAGFWGPLAGRQSRERQQALWGALWTTVVTAFSLFCLLVGLGSWLAGSPEPTWFPLGTAAWIALNIVSGLSLIPYWLRLGFRD